MYLSEQMSRERSRSVSNINPGRRSEGSGMVQVRLPVAIRLVHRVHVIPLVVTFFVNDNHSTSVSLHPTVVRSRKNSCKSCVYKIFNSCLYGLVSSENSSEVAVSNKVPHSIGTKLLNSTLEAISHTDSYSFFFLCGVRPHQVHHKFILVGVAVGNIALGRSLDGHNIRWGRIETSNTTMATQNLVFRGIDNSSQGEPLKHFADAVEDAHVVGSKALSALGQEAVLCCNAPVLVVTTEQSNFLGVLHFERHKEADSLKRVTAAVDVVPEEQVVEGVDVTLGPIVRHAPVPKEPHQVRVLAVNVAKHFYRRFHH